MDLGLADWMHVLLFLGNVRTGGGWPGGPCMEGLGWVLASPFLTPRFFFLPAAAF